jgi:hypothetical protein
MWSVSGLHLPLDCLDKFPGCDQSFRVGLSKNPIPADPTTICGDALQARRRSEHSRRLSVVRVQDRKGQRLGGCLGYCRPEREYAHDIIKIWIHSSKSLLCRIYIREFRQRCFDNRSSLLRLVCGMRTKNCAIHPTKFK